MAVGRNTVSSGSGSIAMGQAARSVGTSGIAIGSAAQALGDEGTAVGAGATIASGALQSSAFGVNSSVTAAGGMALGYDASAVAINAVALGAGSLADQADTISVGAAGAERRIVNVAAGSAPTDAVNVSQLATVTADTRYFQADGLRDGSDDAAATGTHATAAGASASASADASAAFGAGASANEAQGLALGAGATVNNAASVALGSGATTSIGAQTGYAAAALAAPQNSVGEVSVGSAGQERQITHVAAGSADTDAVNVAQLRAVQVAASDAMLWDPAALGGTGAFSASHLGSGPHGIVDLAAGVVAAGSLEAINGGQLYAGAQAIATVFGAGSTVAPDGSVTGTRFVLDGHAYGTVDDALTYLANRSAPPAGGSSGAFVAQSAGSAGASGNNAVAAGSNARATASNSVALGADSIADRANTVSIGRAGAERQITRVAAGTAPTDAANVSQVDQALVTARSYADAGDATTLSRANAYTDSRLVGSVSRTDFDAFRGQVADQFHTVNRRIDRVGAIGTAMAGMAGAIAAAPSTESRVSAAVGGYRGEGALAVGYAHQLPRNGSILLGGSVAGSGETGAAVGVSFGW